MSESTVLTAKEEAHLNDWAPLMEAGCLMLIDTNQYAGNFESDMGLYVTGVNDDFAKSHTAVALVAELPASEHTKWIKAYACPLETQEYKGVAAMGNMWPTPGMFCNGVGVTYEGPQRDSRDSGAMNSVAVGFTEVPSLEVRQELRRRAEVFCTKFDLALKGVRFIEVSVPRITLTVKAVD